MKYIEIRTGSDSDISKIKEIYSLLKELNIDYSPRILSAHRTPIRMAKEAQNLEKNNFRVSISAAGGSAHLAGMTASETAIPVVALPVESSLGGEDALLSMVQIPPGIPNGTVGIGEAVNAGILASRIAYLDNKEIRKKLASKLGTKVISNLSNKPIINIVTSFSNVEIEKYIEFSKNFDIECTINQKNTSPVVIYIDDVSKFPEIVDKTVEQISILAPYKKEFELCSLSKLITGPYAWVGINRINNAIIYAVQILGIYFPEVRVKFKQYKKQLFDEVVEKDKNLQKKGVSIYIK